MLVGIFTIRWQSPRFAVRRGEKDKALDLQRRALAVADGPDERQDMQAILDFLLGKK